MTELLTIQQVMEKLQVSDETVYRYIHSGKLKAVRAGGLWRVSQEELDKFLSGNGSLKRGNRRGKRPQTVCPAVVPE